MDDILDIQSVARRFRKDGETITHKATSISVLSERVIEMRRRQNNGENSVRSITITGGQIIAIDRIPDHMKGKLNDLAVEILLAIIARDYEDIKKIGAALAGTSEIEDEPRREEPDDIPF